MSQHCDHGYVEQRIGDGPCDICAELQALADVRALDAWATSHQERTHVFFPADDEIQCFISMRHSRERSECFSGATPDEARAKAAAWARKQESPK